MSRSSACAPDDTTANGNGRPARRLRSLRQARMQRAFEGVVAAYIRDISDADRGRRGSPLTTE
jgi:hypothetical protein